MWLFTPFGFFSAVRKRGDSDLTIRSRTRGDLLRLRRHYLPELTEPVAHQGGDYPWRGRCAPEAFGKAVDRIARQIDYDNFKDEVAHYSGASRAKRYGKVWQALYGMEEDFMEPDREGFDGLPWSIKPPVGKKRAFGGVVVDTQGRLLLREVANHFDGYVWTFAKGRPDEGESPRQTALREVREEMGVQARIVLPLPSTFTGTTTQTQFFLMVVDARSVDLDHQCKETSRLCWALPDEAQRLIAQTSNEVGRKRDQLVLAEALSFLPTPAPYQRPIARQEDWEFRPMPATRTTLEYQRVFSPPEMAQIIRGFLSQAMEQKWCVYFEDGILRFHRSWTGIEIFRMHLMPAKAKKGHWEVVRTELNQHPGQSTWSEREALGFIPDLVENMLLRFGEEPWMDGLALAIMEASKPNYLGSPRVVQWLLKPLFDAIYLSHCTDEEEDTAIPRAKRTIIEAMTDDPEYTRMPWHSREQLGETLIQTMDLPSSADTLTQIVRMALDKLERASLQLLPSQDPDEDELEAWLHKLEPLGQFAVAVFLGSHVLSHRGKTLDGLVLELAADSSTDPA